MKWFAIFGLVLASAVPSARPQTVNRGHYVGTVQAEWLPDGRGMRLIAPLTFVDPLGSNWLAPSGSVVDGASIPRFAWSITGGPFEGKYRDASVIHDVACAEKKRPWPKVHQVFYDAMVASGVDGTAAKVMYAAVFHFGPRWPTKPPGGVLGGAVDVPPPVTMTEGQFAQLRAQIESREGGAKPLTLEEIRAFQVKQP